MIRQILLISEDLCRRPDKNACFNVPSSVVIGKQHVGVHLHISGILVMVDGRGGASLAAILLHSVLTSLN